MKTIELDGNARLHIPWVYNPKKRITVAVATLFGDGQIAEVTGFSKANRTDKWDKSTGRKLSLTRALAHFPKPDRKKVWEAYFNRSPKGLNYK